MAARARSAITLGLILASLACAPASDRLPPPAASDPPPSPPSSRSISTRQPSPTLDPVRLSLDRLFHPGGEFRGEPSRIRTLVATGDVIPARLVNIQATQRGDFAYPFRPTAESVRDADLTFMNLETPLLPGCPARPTGVHFCADPGFVDGLRLAGAKVVNLANNHIYPGPELTATQELLSRHRIRSLTHLGPPEVIDVRGLRFAFIGCNAVTGGPRVDRERLRTRIQEARRLADVVVIQFHWGKEYERLPLPAPGVAPDDPIELGHLAVDAGADLVIGNHPHWVQGVEVYHDRLITYAHGNYVFDQVVCYPAIGPDYRTYCSDDTRTSVIGRYTFYDNQLVAATWRVTFTDPGLQTQWADADRSALVLAQMEAASRLIRARAGT